MKKLIKSLLLITIILCISTLTSVFAATSIPEATTDFYVNDFADVFSEEEKSELINNAVKLANESDGIQIVISTINSLDGDTVENYALNMYNQYGIGKNDMGLLILLSTGDRQIRVEVGKAMESYINDSKAGRFIDKYAISYLKENKFNEGLISLQNAFIKEINTCISRETTNPPSSNQTSSAIDFSFLLLLLAILLFIGIIIYIIALITKNVKKRKKHIKELELEISNLISQKETLKKAHDFEKEALNKSIHDLKHNNLSLQASLSNTEKTLEEKTDRYNRILKIYPDADAKVNAMIKTELIEKDKQIAAEVDSLISDVIELNPDKDLVKRLSSVISKYKNLTHEQKSYIKNNITKLENLYENSLKLKEVYEKKLEEERIRKLTQERKNKASSVTKEILAIISAIGIARAHDLYRLNDAKELYDDLDSETQKYVDDSVISKLKSLISAAKRDKEEEEEAERRRRQSSYSSSYRSSSNSFRGGGFGGFGGRSGGGGASRGF